MKKTLFVVASALALFLAVTAAAQKAVTFTASNTTIDGIDLRPTADGGIALTVHGTNRPSGSDVTLQRARTCAVENLTTAQKAALQTLRNAALSCWNTGEGL